MTLRPGDVVVRRDVFRGRIWSALPHVVVDDGHDELVADAAAGRPPFDGSWTGWRPDGLEPPDLPAHWATGPAPAA